MTPHDQDHDTLLRRHNREGAAALSSAERRTLQDCPECGPVLGQLQQTLGELMNFADMHHDRNLGPPDELPPPPVRATRPPEWMAQPQAPRKRDWSGVIAALLVAIVLAAAAVVI